MYVNKVRGRALAVYQVGTIKFPGISDIDLLVVAETPRSDNNQYFSVFQRLPRAYHRLFLHEPFVLPLRTLSVLLHTSHAQPILLSGPDILAGLTPLQNREEKWCKLFESYCNFAVYLDQCREREELSGRLAVAVASSMRYALRDLDELCGTEHAAHFSEQVDAQRNLLMTADLARAAEIAGGLLQVLQDKMTWLKTTVEQLMPESQGRRPCQFADEFLRGRTGSGLNRSLITRRWEAIDDYHQELKRLKFSYGHLFFFAAYGTAPGRYRQNRALRVAFSLPYRVRQLFGR